MDPITASALATTGINAVSQGLQNRANRRFQRQMFDKTNEYNTPLNQVKRMKEAGLNPALMYQGSPQNTATQVSATKGDAYKIPETLFADVAQKLAQKDLTVAQTPAVQVNIDNTRADTDKKIQDTNTSAIHAQKLAQETALLNQQYDFTRGLFATNTDARKEELRKLQNENTRLEKQISYLDEETKSKIQNLKQSFQESVMRTKSLENDVWVKQNDQELRELYINPNSNNIADTILRYIVGNGKQLLETSKNK